MCIQTNLIGVKTGGIDGKVLFWWRKPLVNGGLLSLKKALKVNLSSKTTVDEELCIQELEITRRFSHVAL